MMVEARQAPFTVKWQYAVDGIERERIIEADQVNIAYDSRPADHPSAVSAMLGVYSVPTTGLVVCGNPESGAESMALSFGRVYVMNREGKTVARYNLADPQGSGTNTQSGIVAKSTAQLRSEAGGKAAG